MIALIVAIAKNGVIGACGRIPWKIPGEQKRFRELTTGNTVIMGRHTYEEIGHPLPNRDTVVVSRFSHFEGERCRTASSLSEALGMSQTEDVFICGGAALYAEAIPLVDVMYITEIHAEFDGDVLFPAFDASLFEKTEEASIDGEIPYTYVTYKKIK
jgi:dihydrofolate reductase